MILPGRQSMLSAVAGMIVLGCISAPAQSWGDEGHEVIALIADHYLEPAVRAQVNALLAGDRTGLTSNTRIDQEATWADKYRDSDRRTTQVRYNRTRNWHYVDLELAGPDLHTACFGRPALPMHAVASAGPADDCVVDKIEQFAAELASPATGTEERRLALEYLLHFVGDIHQPLHAADDHDHGGNLKIVIGPGMPPNNLHHAWDGEFVERLGSSAAGVAQSLIVGISAAQRAQWASGGAADWAMESYALAKAHSYGLLPRADAANRHELSAAYVDDAINVTREQLGKAGVRLAFVLNRALRQAHDGR